MPADARQISAMLAGRVAELVRELLPHGRRDGHEWRCGSLAGEKGRSLAVHLSGSRAGLWADFGGDERGDALDLVGQVLYRGDRRQAMDWARAWLGIGVTSLVQAPERRTAVPRDDWADTEMQERRAAAKRIWHGGCVAGLRDTPVDAYLAGRGIALEQLGRAPGALRFHPELWNAESKRPWPAMVAAISGPIGELAAVHRTWLAKDAAGGWGKAPLDVAKMTLGSYAGGSIRLQRGASRKPLAQAPDDETVAIAEGIETALSVALSCPDMRVLAAVSLANMGRVVLPAAIHQVLIAADNDAGNEPARRALRAAIARFIADGRVVRLAIPSIPGADWNDILRQDEAA